MKVKLLCSKAGGFLPTVNIKCSKVLCWLTEPECRNVLVDPKEIHQ